MCWAGRPGHVTVVPCDRSKGASLDVSWLSKIGAALQAVRTPLSLGGLTVLVLCIIYNRILGMPIFSAMKGDQTAQLIGTMAGYVFWLALVAIVLGIAGYLIRPAGPAKN